MIRSLPAILWMMLLHGTAGADPSPDLFDRLKSAPDAAQAADIADDIWASLLESGSPTADLMMQRAIRAIEAGDTALARELLDRVILMQPGFSEAWHRRAGIFLSEENLVEALQDLNQALILEPRHFGALLGMAHILEQLGGTREALETYRRILEIYPLMPQAQAAESRLRLKTEGMEL